MPETTADKTIFSLLEVTRSIQKTLGERYGSSFWVKAEMNKLNYYPHSGHCYPDLVEKKDGRIIAQLRSTLWKDDFLRINDHFMRVVKTPLRDGITMLFCARISFDPVHGLSLRILDIDPVFSLGELEREKLETIEMLQREGVFNRNKELRLPQVPQRIAIISVETSKGYADFQKVIGNNPGGYRVFYMLFPSVLQGERAVESMSYQLSRIRRVARHFDAVAIIRGGGGEVGLSCFNNAALAREVALFPVPIITGIGHATNETVVEMIAHKNAITPTDLANFLLERFDAFAKPVLAAEEVIAECALRILGDQNNRLASIVKYFRSVSRNLMASNSHVVDTCSQLIVQRARHLIDREKHAQQTMQFELKRKTIVYCSGRRVSVEQNALTLKKDVAAVLRERHQVIGALDRGLQNMRPENVLKRGYSITRINGTALRSYKDVNENDLLSTTLADGVVESQVISANKTIDNE